MTTDLAASVKKLTQTWSRGGKLAKKFGKVASSEYGGDAEELSAAVGKLQRALEKDSEAVTADYNKCHELHGEFFVRALEEDGAVYSKLQDLRMDLIDLINQIQDLEADTFEMESLDIIRVESEKISERCLAVFQSAIQSQWNQGWSFMKQGQHDAESRGSQHLSRSASGSTGMSYSTTTTQLRGAVEDEPIESPRTSQLSASSTDAERISKDVQLSVPTQERSSDATTSQIEPNSNNGISEVNVDDVVKANDDFLERRRQSRLNFYQGIRFSVISIDENKESNFDVISAVSHQKENKESNFDVISPVSPVTASPTEARPRDLWSRSSSDYTAFVSDKRGGSQTFEKKRTSVASSVQTASTTPGDAKPSSSKHTSEDFFGVASPQSDDTSSKDLAATLKLPGYGNGVESGLEPVETPMMVDHDNEKILVPKVHPEHRTSSVKSIDSPMRHDSSFYKFGGFCDGAKASLRGELGYKIANRPTGTWGSADYAKCIKCSFEISLSQIEKDARMDITGIYGSHRIRWRQQFLTKSHVRTSTAEEPLYACLFCIEDRKTPEEHDATVFFTPSQLFGHLARHPRPFPKVNGIIALYGAIPVDTTNFDLHIMKSEPTLSKFNMTEIAPEVAVRPTASALITYHPRSSRSNSKDPDGNPTLHFAAGARILGITFPPHFAGAWCTGYHDGEKGSFPSAAISLEPPGREDVFMSPQSSLVAFARWEFKPKEGKEGWLRFSKGEKIVNIGYTFQDQWCWSGQTKNGKWGLFPAAFVEGLQDGGPYGVEKSKSGRLFSKLGRSTGSVSRTVRSPSIKSTGSGGRVPTVKSQPGLEVVVNGVAI